MNARFRSVLTCATILASLLPIGAVQAQTAQPRNLYVFGDQSVVNGNDAWFWDYQYQYGFEAGGPPNPRYTGVFARFSDGANWTERLGFQLGLSPGLYSIRDPWGGFTSQNRGYNFAHALTTVNGIVREQNGYFGWGSAPARNLNEQINAFNRFADQGQIKRQSTDVFIISNSISRFCPIGVNCLTDFAFAEASQQYGNSYLALTKANKAALHILIGEFNPTLVVNYVLTSSNYTATYNEFLARDAFVSKFNTYLNLIQNGALKAGLRTEYIDPNAPIRDIIARPQAYGITYTTTTYTEFPIGYDTLLPDGTIGPGTGLLSSGYCRDAYGRVTRDRDAVLTTNCGDYLWWSPGVLSSRGNDIFATYVTAYLKGRLGWDVFRAASSGAGAAPIAATKTATAGTTSKGFASSLFGLNQVQTGEKTKVFSLGMSDEDSVGTLGLNQSRNGSLQLIGSSTQLTNSLRVGGSYFRDKSRLDDINARVSGSGGASFATLNLGQGLDLNVIASSQERTLNTSRQNFYYYVGGIARARTKVRLDVAQASLSKMFDVKGVQVGPIASVAQINERWGEVRETGVPDWLAFNRPATQLQSTALNLGLGADWSHTDRAGGEWHLSAKTGRIEADPWAPIALVAPTQTLAYALEREKGSVNFATIAAGREIDRGWSLGLEAAIAENEERRMVALRANAALKF